MRNIAESILSADKEISQPRYGKVVACSGGTVDVLPLGGNAVLHDIPLLGQAELAEGDEVILFVEAGKRWAIPRYGKAEEVVDKLELQPKISVSNYGSGGGMVQHELDGAWHIGNLPWSRVSKTGSSLAHLVTRNYVDLQNRAHALDGADHTGLLSWAKVNKTGSSLADLATRNYSDLQNRAHALDGADHTGTLSWSKVDKAGSSLADLATRNYSDLQNRVHNIISEHSGTGAQLDLVGFVSTDTLGVITPSSNPGQARAIMATNASGGFTFSGNVSVGNMTLATNATISTSSALLLGGQSVRPVSDAFTDLGLPSARWKELNVLAIRANQLVQHASISTIGGRFLVGLSAKLVSPVLPSDTQIVVDSNGFANQDVILFQKGTVTEYMRITSGATASGGGWRYSVTRDLTNTNSPDPEWDVGDVCFNTGQIGTGWLDLFSSAWPEGPAIDVKVRTGANAGDVATRVKIGKLDGVNDPDFGALSGYGLLAENANIKGSLFATGRIRAGSGNNTVIIDPNDSVYRLWAGHQNAANAPFKIETDGSVIAKDGEIGGWLIDQHSIKSANSGARVVLDNRQYGGLISYGPSDNFDPSSGSGSYQVRIDKQTGDLLAGEGQIKIGSYGIRLHLLSPPSASKPIQWLNESQEVAGEVTFSLNGPHPLLFTGMSITSFFGDVLISSPYRVNLKAREPNQPHYSWPGLTIRGSTPNDPPRATFTGSVVEISPPVTHSPIQTYSTLLCQNLNADLLDGQHASAFAQASHTHSIPHYGSAPQMYISTSPLDLTQSWQFVPGLDTGDITPTANETWLVWLSFRINYSPSSPGTPVQVGDHIRAGFDVNGTRTRADGFHAHLCTSTSGVVLLPFFEVISVNANQTTRLRISALNANGDRGRVALNTYMVVWRLRA